MRGSCQMAVTTGKDAGCVIGQEGEATLFRNEAPNSVIVRRILRRGGTATRIQMQGVGCIIVE